MGENANGSKMDRMGTPPVNIDRHHYDELLVKVGQSKLRMLR
jgi:hypothetical protein